MSLTFTNIRLNVFKPTLTNSWTLTSKENNGLFAIDKIPDGMTMKFLCTYPCETCSALDSTVCDSCNTVENFTILYNNKCYKECPDGTYFSNYRCYPCAENCKTCTRTNPKDCASCASTSIWPFLSGNTCQNFCDFG